MIFSVKGLSTAPLTSLIDEGWYHVNVLGISTVTASTGTVGIKLHFSILNGPVQEATGVVPVGRQVFPSPIWLTPIGLTQFANFCAKIGVDRSNEEQDDQAYIGKEVLVKFVHEDYKGEPQLKIGNFKELPTE